MKVKSESEVAQLCLTLSDPMDCSLSQTGKPGVLLFMGSQRVRHDLATEKQQHAIFPHLKNSFILTSIFSY